MRRARLFALGTVVTLLGIWLVDSASRGRAGEGKDGLWKPILPEAEVAKLAKHDIKVIQDILEKQNLDKSKIDPDDLPKYKMAMRKLKATALMLALYAQSNMSQGGDKAKELATVRDKALEFIKALNGEDVAKAKELAKELAAGPKADPNAKLDPVELHKVLKFEDVMHQFATEKTGGFGYEKDYEEFAESKDPLTPEQMEKLLFMVHKTAMLGQIVHANVPAKDDEKEEKKTRKNWVSFTEEFRKSTQGLAEAVKSKKDADIKSALTTLNMSCKKCHDVFQ